MKHPVKKIKTRNTKNTRLDAEAFNSYDRSISNEPWLEKQKVPALSENDNGHTERMADKPIRFYYEDDGTAINPELVRKPPLCASCAKDDDPDEEPLCILTRYDQREDEEFQCDAYVAKRKDKKCR